MSIEIRYCLRWSYKPRAASLAAIIERATGQRVRLTPGRVGQFDVLSGDRIVFSKEKSGRFPEPDEILAHLAPA